MRGSICFKSGDMIGRELHLIDNIFLQINPGGNFNQCYAFRFQLENSPLGNLENLLTALTAVFSAKGDVFHLFDQFFHLALIHDL